MHGAAAAVLIMTFLGATPGAPVLLQVLQVIPNILQGISQIVQILPHSSLIAAPQAPLPQGSYARAAVLEKRATRRETGVLGAKKAPRLVALGHH